MFLLQPIHHDLHVGVTFNKPCVCNILARVVNTITETSQVMDDAAHQRVVWLLSAVEENYLLFEKVQQSGKVKVIFVPDRKWGSHGCLLGTGRQVAVDTIIDRSALPDTVFRDPESVVT